MNLTFHGVAKKSWKKNNTYYYIGYSRVSTLHINYNTI